VRLLQGFTQILLIISTSFRFECKPLTTGGATIKGNAPISKEPKSAFAEISSDGSMNMHTLPRDNPFSDRIEP
jgi:hypothetical protein